MPEPLFNCAKMHRYGFKGDHMGLLLVLADLWEKDRSLFGNTEAEQDQARVALANIIENPERNEYGQANAWATANAIVALFEERGINPLKDISIINVSPTKSHAPWWQPLIDCCGKDGGKGSYKAILPTLGTEGEYCTTRNVERLCGGKKADYVITGNVIGYIESQEATNDFMKASAMMANKDGRIIHLLDMATTEKRVEYLNSDAAYHSIGQRFLKFIPDQESMEPPIASIATQQRGLDFDGKFQEEVNASTVQLRGKQRLDDGPAPTFTIPNK